MKPTKWQDCPDALLNRFLWECELEYDPYESSKAEAIHSIECDPGSMSSENSRIIRTAWSFLSEDTFSAWVKQGIESLEIQLTELLSLEIQLTELRLYV